MKEARLVRTRNGSLFVPLYQLPICILPFTHHLFLVNSIDYDEQIQTLLSMLPVENQAPNTTEIQNLLVSLDASRPQEMLKTMKWFSQLKYR